MSGLSSSVLAVPPVEKAIEHPFRRGIQYALAGDYPKAIELFSQALLIAPENADIYGNRCVARHRSGDRAGAIADCRKAAELYKHQGNLARHQYALKCLSHLQMASLVKSQRSPPSRG